MKAFNVIVTAVFVGVVGFITYSLTKASTQKYYATTRLEAATIEEKLFLSGFVYPGKEIEIKPQISGVVDAVFVSVGDQVKEGDPIASVRLVPNSSEVEHLSSHVNIARIDFTAAKTRYERQKQLLEAKAVSRVDFEAVEKDYMTARENLASAEHQLALRRRGRQLSGNLVRASTSGVVIDIPVKEGTSVMERSGYNPGSTVAVLAGTDHFVFKSDVPEQNIGQLEVGMPVYLSMSAVDSLDLTATIVKISAKGEIQGGAVRFPIEAVFRVDGRDQTIRSGYSATAEVHLRVSEHAMTLPEKAICFRGDTCFVYVTDSLKRTARQREVTLGLSDGERVEILDGLAPSDEVITNYHD